MPRLSGRRVFSQPILPAGVLPNGVIESSCFEVGNDEVYQSRKSSSLDLTATLRQVRDSVIKVGMPGVRPRWIA
ncbi:hypothetical protein QE432_002152 [Agrobacterium sp. SORGH_AS 745]|nr:hypothetical protein [Agrobacterium tumefaciens]MDQ1220571.1 hypothetical protein [Agrobacterium sp. SORGH_AS_0745]